MKIKSLILSFSLGIMTSAIGARWISTAQDAPVASAPAAGSKEKLNDIRKLMVVTGAGDMGKQVMKQMVDSFKKSAPGMPNEFFDRLVESVDTDELVNLTIPIYDKYLSHEDIKGMTQFYESPTGKNVIKALPKIAQESMQAGQKWGMELSRKLMAEIEREREKEAEKDGEKK